MKYEVHIPSKIFNIDVFSETLPRKGDTFIYEDKILEVSEIEFKYDNDTLETDIAVYTKEK